MNCIGKKIKLTSKPAKQPLADLLHFLIVFLMFLFVFFQSEQVYRIIEAKICICLEGRLMIYKLIFFYN